MTVLDRAADRRGILPGGPRPTARRRRNWREWLTGWLFVLPAAVLFAVFGAYTVGYGFLLSFAKWNGLSPHWTWVGLDNFAELLWSRPSISDPVRAAGLRTLAVMIALPVSVVLVSLPLAVLLNSVRRLRTALRTIYFLPYVTTGLAVFYAWRFMYDPDGVINAGLRLVGLDRFAQADGWLGNPDTAFGAVILVLVWGNVPLGLLLFLTGLQTIDPALEEAARVDGAGRWRILRSVVIPLLNPITALVVVLTMREALQNYQIFLLMTNGGPLERSNVLGLQVYSFAFGKYTELGYASALGWTLFVVALVLAAVNFRLLRDRTGA